MAGETEETGGSFEAIAGCLSRSSRERPALGEGASRLDTAGMKHRTLDFRDHRRELDENRHVYAVISRRAGGLSIGLNLNADKVCNFDCPYCQVDRRSPGGPREVDLERLEAELSHLLGLLRSGTLWQVPPFDTAAPALRQVYDIAWAGDGEPTSSSAFGDSVDRVVALRERFELPAVRLHLLSNATLFQRPAVAQALDRFTAAGGVIWGKLDAGTEPWFHLVDGTRLPFQRVLDNLALASTRWRLVLQCLFISWQGQGPSDEEITAWVGRIEALLAQGGRIEEVQITSIARRPAQRSVGLVETARLEEIAARAAALGVPVRVFPGVDPGPDPAQG